MVVLPYRSESFAIAHDFVCEFDAVRVANKICQIYC